MKSMINNQRSILFVSHSLPSIRNFCTKAIWMKDGTTVMQNEAHIVCEAYSDYMKNLNKIEKIELKELKNDNKDDKTILIKNVSMQRNEYLTDEDIEISIDLQFNKETFDYGIGILVHNEEGKLVTLFNTIRDDIVFNKISDNIKLIIPNNDFLVGNYFISISISDLNVMFSYDREDYILEFKVKNKLSNNNLPVSEGLFRSKHFWKINEI